jgi:Asp-tRNA(Asn)/Glu-tRNA(Gln) amidotransferase A subunit family amidase
MKMNEEFNVIELTIDKFHESIRSGKITSKFLVEIYLERIKIFDKPSGLNSMVVINKNAVKTAEELDKEFTKTGKLRALHGVPAIIKDNFDTYDLQTSGGSLALKNSFPPDDAFQIKKLRDAGVIIIGKSNMAEWAFSPYQTVSSILGTTRNPYDLDRVPAGSSGGTAAAIAANFGLIGLGTDTGNSIRGPSSHCCLVGLRSTMGLTSRDGIIPLYLRNDIGGPMCRTLEDTIRVLDVIAGFDSEDYITSRSIGKKPCSYLTYLDKEGLVNKRIGVFRYFTEQISIDLNILKVFEKALSDIEKCGAVLIDPFEVDYFEELTQDLWCNTFKHDLNKYLGTLESAKYRTLSEIVESGIYSQSIRDRLIKMSKTDPNPKYGDLFNEPRNIRLRETISAAMDQNEVDVIVYPTWSNPPRFIGDLESPAGDNSQIIPPHTGFPGLTVPMGFTYNDLPAGIQFVGGLFSEPTLIEATYSYEQATHHRKPPNGF